MYILFLIVRAFYILSWKIKNNSIKYFKWNSLKLVILYRFLFRHHHLDELFIFYFSIAIVTFCLAHHLINFSRRELFSHSRHYLHQLLRGNNSFSFSIKLTKSCNYTSFCFDLLFILFQNCKKLRKWYFVSCTIFLFLLFFSAFSWNKNTLCCVYRNCGVFPYLYVTEIFLSCVVFILLTSIKRLLFSFLFLITLRYCCRCGCFFSS